MNQPKNKNDDVKEAGNGSNAPQSDVRRAAPVSRPGPRRHPGPGQRRRPGSRYKARRRVPPVKEEDIDWKNLQALRFFIGPDGAIRPRRRTGATARMQRKVARAIKRARHMALLPYTGEHGRLYRNGK